MSALDSQLLKLVSTRKAKIVVTIIGGQGYLFGRGNQQISHRIIDKAGKENIVAIAAASKIIDLNGNALLVNTGNDETDQMLSGYIKVKTGNKENVICKLNTG